MLLRCSLLLSLARLIGAVTVETPYGSVEGFAFKSANVFLGVRYADAPIGDLRFEKPRQVGHWSGVRKATEFGASCYPTNLELNAHIGNFTYSEDCLFLNLMAPKKTPKGGESYPVVVYVHGGGFEIDTATKYGYKGVVDNFVSEGIVFVTFNYRLGPFGFLTTADDVLPGNIGLWDQFSALKFVTEIVSAFGGNPEQITVMGGSSGAVSVSALTLSPHSNKMISKAIQLSGSFYLMSLEGNRRHALRFIAAIGCANEDLQVAKGCLKTKSPAEMLNATNQLGPPVANGHAIGSLYEPYVDGRFLPADLHELIKEAPVIPTITGVTDSEAGFFVFDYTNSSFIEVPPANYGNFSAQDLRETLRKVAANISDLYPLLEDFYVDRFSASPNSSFYLTQQVNVASDITYVVPAFQEAVEKMRQKWPVYLYVEKHYSASAKRNAIPVKGCFHTNEGFYLFGTRPTFPVEMNDDDRRFKRNFLEGLTSFVKGKPEIDGKEWIPLAEDDYSRYMSLNVTSEMKHGFFEERMKFWTKEVVERVNLDDLKTLLPQSRAIF